MNINTPSYTPIDLDAWPRREHFHYYRNFVKCSYSVTVRIDITSLLRFSHANHYRFYGCSIYLFARTVNEMPEMRMMLTPKGTPGIWDVVHPNFTVFHKDDHTFSDLWTTYDDDFSVFYQNFEQVLATYGDIHGIKGRSDQPANFFCVSCVPWMDFTACSTSASGDPNLFPIFTYGKYTEENGRFIVPVTLTISHAAADGYHASQFFERLQYNMDHTF